MARQHLKATSCFLVAILCALGFSQPWRPQGRFGKRLSLSSGEDSSRDAAVEFISFHEVPVEALFSDREIDQFQTKPRLCSVSGHQDYPVCQFLRATPERNSNELGNFFDL